MESCILADWRQQVSKDYEPIWAAGLPHSLKPRWLKMSRGDENEAKLLFDMVIDLKVLVRSFNCESRACYDTICYVMIHWIYIVCHTVVVHNLLIALFLNGSLATGRYSMVLCPVNPTAVLKLFRCVSNDFVCRYIYVTYPYLSQFAANVLSLSGIEFGETWRLQLTMQNGRMTTISPIKQDICGRQDIVAGRGQQNLTLTQ